MSRRRASSRRTASPGAVLRWRHSHDNSVNHKTLDVADGSAYRLTLSHQLRVADKLEEHRLERHRERQLKSKCLGWMRREHAQVLRAIWVPWAREWQLNSKCLRWMRRE